MQVKAKERELRVLMVGLDNAGKTTVVKRVNGESIDEISPTLGFNIKTMTYGDYSLNVWDVGGQKTLRAYWRNYYEATDGLIWVVDSADSRRMRDCAEALASVLEEEKLAGASVLVFANKRDIRGAMDVDAIADAVRGRMSALLGDRGRVGVEAIGEQTLAHRRVFGGDGRGVVGWVRLVGERLRRAHLHARVD